MLVFVLAFHLTQVSGDEKKEVPRKKSMLELVTDKLSKMEKLGLKPLECEKCLAGARSKLKIYI